MCGPSSIPGNALGKLSHMPPEPSLECECGTDQNGFDNPSPDSTYSRTDSDLSSEVDEESPFRHLLAAVSLPPKLKWKRTKVRPQVDNAMGVERALLKLGAPNDGRCAKKLPRLSNLEGAHPRDPHFACNSTPRYQERPFNMAAEIRTYIRTLGSVLLSCHYRRLRAEVRQLGLRETDEALEFARRYFTVNVLSQAALPPSVVLADLSRAAQGAVLCPRKLCFSSDVWVPAGFNKHEHPWFGHQVAGVGKRLAIAFKDYFLAGDYTFAVGGAWRHSTSTKNHVLAGDAAADCPQPAALIVDASDQPTYITGLDSGADHSGNALLPTHVHARVNVYTHVHSHVHMHIHMSIHMSIRMLAHMSTVHTHAYGHVYAAHVYT